MLWFPNAEEMDAAQCVFMILVYGFVLLQAAKWIGDGCEMLVLLYGSGIIGSLLIPILGALPDSLIILLSGMGSGSKDEIQQEMAVGVGALVGSTIMLLTLPWGYAVFLGRRDVDPNTNEAASITTSSGKVKPKFTETSLLNNCVTTSDDVVYSAKVLAFVTVFYWIVQVPSFWFKNTSDHGENEEKPYVLASFILTLIALIAYCGLQWRSSVVDEKQKRAAEKARSQQWHASMKGKLAQDAYLEQVFHKYDNGDGLMDLKELYDAIVSMGLKVERREVVAMMEQMDTGIGGDASAKGDGRLSLHEFKAAFKNWLKPEFEQSIHTHAEEHMVEAPLPSEEPNLKAHLNQPRRTSILTARGLDSSHFVTSLNNVAEHESDDEDSDDEEENFWELTDTQLKYKAIGLLVFATVVVAIFSDPMVDVLNQFGKQINVSPFYLSFVIAPIASNASEVLAGLQFAAKKSTEGISLCHSSLLGGACMNATLGLCVFMALIYFRGLTWSFTAEVIAVTLVSVFVAINNFYSKTIKLWQGVFVMTLYPLSIILVYLLENVAGLD